ncbi:TlpA family protein disulfide reductase [Limnovirga soli]|uniref:Redoxin domain-containing protein n=1 Tax=Limnovirga soli TaxID=2656915 RepID=A0A8J8JTB7_9BACT|nr:TlpA disulfide reductase family protein [Limnovirga soli]NNV57872.1 redoxin domain-containing protein [Limnovirga soli]
MKYLSVIFLLLVFIACDKERQNNKVTIAIKGAIGKKIFLYKIGFLDEPDALIDSATVIDMEHSIMFGFDGSEEGLYKIKVAESAFFYQFINDKPDIQIDINNINGKYTIYNSPASNSLKAFTEQQAALFGAINDAEKNNSNLHRQHLDISKISPLGLEKVRAIFDSLYSRSLIYTDTVSSAAALIAVYNTIDFDNHHDDLQVFIDKASERFPVYKPIMQLKTEVYAMLSIYREEFQIGDTLPPINLPDETGRLFSTAELQGNYYLLEFWSTYCDKCVAYNKSMKNIWQSPLTDRIKMVSVALDDEKKIWLDAIRKNDIHWIQLMDEKMWRGAAANTLKFDSIPFNFLVNPQGIIIAKAIPADSLTGVITKFIR